ncbi:MAG: hypothetical protein ACFCD0_08515 [Gemmataceae bacterium]
MLVAENQCLGTQAFSAVEQDILEPIEWLETRLDGLDEQLQMAIEDSPLWREREGLLRSDPSVGPQTALVIGPLP